MTPEELIAGLRERGLFVTRMQQGPTTLVNVKALDPLAEFLGSTLHCRMIDFRPEAWSQPRLRAYEVRLHTALVECDPPEGLEVGDPDYQGKLAAHRANLIWEAAAA